MISWILGIVVVVGFAYFVYTRIKASKNRPGGGRFGGGNRLGAPTQKK